ncbi:conserved hypothetical protein [Pseudomonas sp. IT-P294]
MVSGCSHCSFALLFVKSFVIRLFIETNIPEDFTHRVDTELKTGDSPCDSCPLPPLPSAFSV